MSCLDEAVLAALLEGTLDAEGMACVDEHVDRCAECRALVADLMLLRSTDSLDDRPPTPRSPKGADEVGRRYRLLDLVGQGGMGSVHRAFDRLTGETVALKRLLVTPSARPDLTPLAREFRTLATLRHPNIISVLDHGFDSARRPYFTMELLDGAEPILPFAAAAPRATQIELLVQLLSALGYLHRRGVVHRDIKPRNVLVTGGASPALKLLDFGLSTVRDEPGHARAAGTLPYMAPELLRGEAASEASDLYAVGVVAYEMLVGRHPFRAGGEPAAMIARVLGAEPDVAPLPPALRAPIGRALDKSPSRRPADAATMLGELATAAGLAPCEPAGVRDGLFTAARFTGRNEELRRLRHALSSALGGHGAAWLVGGESGVGKSRLLDELRIHALSEGVLAVRGQALPTGGTAYQVWHRVLEILALHVDLSPAEASLVGAILPNLGALLDRDVAPPPVRGVEVTRFRLLRVLRDMVARSRDPVLVLLEDLHWADAESLSLLAQVGEDVGELSLLVVGTYRDDEAPGLLALLPAMEGLRLERFDRDGVAALCASMLGGAGGDAWLVDLVARETAGNALFVVEATRALAEASGGLAAIARGVPERVLAGGMDQVFARRLARVPGEARSFLCVAAIAGRQLDLDVLSRCVPRLDALVREAAEAGVLEVHEQRFRFAHDKLREQVIGALGAREREGLHARVAEAIAATYPASDLHAARLAHHYRAAGRLAEAARFYALAGEAALAHGAASEAETMLDRARALHQEGHAPLLDMLRVWRGLTEARYACGRLVETHEALARVCALAGAPLPSGTPGIVWTLGLQAAEQLARRTGLAKVLRLDPRGEAETGRSEQLLLGLAVGEIYVWLVRPELMLLTTLWGLNLEAALESHGRTNFRAAMAFILTHTPLRGLAVRYLAEATTEVAGTTAAIDLLRMEALMHVNAGRWTAAAAAASRAIESARAHRDDHALLQSLFQRELALGELDDYAGMLSTCREMERLSARTQNPRYTAIALLGQAQARFRLGELDDAAALLDRAQKTGSRDLGPVLEAVVMGVTAACALRREEHARAVALAAEAMGAVRRAGGTVVQLQYALACVLEVWLSVGREGHDREIRAVLADLQRIARRFESAEPNAWLMEGRWAHRRGRAGRAVSALRRSARAAAQLGSRYQEANALFWLGWVAQSAEAQSDVPEGAAAHLETALGMFERLGCAFEAERARAALGALPGVPRSELGITGREPPS